MEESQSITLEPNESTNKGTQESAATCKECSSSAAKYRCPACGHQTCSLRCCTAHKTRLNCTGVRDKTGFVSASKFNDQTLLSDYHFLEDANRMVDNAIRAPKANGNTSAIQCLQKIARKRNIALKLMPALFTRHKENTSNFNTKEKAIFWRIEWVFPSSNVCIIDARVDERKVLEEVLFAHLLPRPGNGPARQKIEAYAQHRNPKDLSLYMQVPSTPVNKPEYYRLSLSDTLMSTLSGKSIIEFPTIYVVLPEMNAEYEANIHIKTKGIQGQENSKRKRLEEDDNDEKIPKGGNAEQQEESQTVIPASKEEGKEEEKIEEPNENEFNEQSSEENENENEEIIDDGNEGAALLHDVLLNDSLSSTQDPLSHMEEEKKQKLIAAILSDVQLNGIVDE